MRFTFGSVVGAGAALVSLAACSTGGSQVSPAAGQGTQSHARAAAGALVRTQPISLDYPASLRGIVPVENRAALTFVDPATVKAQIDVSQYAGSTSDPGGVNEYAANNSKNKAPFCALSNLLGVNAIETDSSGNLWVPNVTSSNDNVVVEYAPDCGSAGTTLTDTNGQPVDIAFASNGIIYVSDILGNGSEAGDISVFPKGATEPSSKLTNPKVFFSLGVAVDTKGNVYQSYLGSSGSSGGGVLEFKGGKGSGSVLKGIKLSEPGTVFVDENNNIIVPDQNAITLDTYAPPYTKLTSSFSLKGLSIQCSLNKAETLAACADRANDSVDVYTYPAGKYEYSFTNGLSSQLSTIGIAQDPRY